MTATVPHAWTAGDDATSAFLQTLTNGITQLQGGTPTIGGPLDFAVMFQTITQSLTTSVWTAITLNSEASGCDFAGGHSVTVNTSRYTAVHAGWYQVNGGVSFTVNATGSRAIRFAVNGTAVQGRSITPATPATVATDLTLSKKVYLAVGDYLEIFAWQNSGGALTTAYASPEQGCFLDVEWRHS